MVKRALDIWYDLTGEAAPFGDDEAVAVETVERRGDERWQALGQVDLHWLDHDGKPQSAPASMIERSLDGLRIVSPRKFAVGDEIHVSLPKDEHEVRANVRHGEESGRGWHIGLRLIRKDRRRFERRPAEGPAIMR